MKDACTYCGATDKWEMHRDHVIPSSWLWPSPAGNDASACGTCNRAKGAHDPVSWFSRLIRFDGAVLGRGETLADIRATLIWERWEPEIRAFAALVDSLGAQVPS